MNFRLLPSHTGASSDRTSSHPGFWVQRNSQGWWSSTRDKRNDSKWSGRHGWNSSVRRPSTRNSLTTRKSRGRSWPCIWCPRQPWYNEWSRREHRSYNKTKWTSDYACQRLWCGADWEETAGSILVEPGVSAKGTPPATSRPKRIIRPPDRCGDWELNAICSSGYPKNKVESLKASYRSKQSSTLFKSDYMQSSTAQETKT